MFLISLVWYTFIFLKVLILGKKNEKFTCRRRFRWRSVESERKIVINFYFCVAVECVLQHALQKIMRLLRTIAIIYRIFADI